MLTRINSFKCRVGGEWKPSDCFSKNQLAKWHQARRSRNSTTNAANIGLTCREHSGEPNLGLHCNGPCGLWKAREQFSTNQRRNNLRVRKYPTFLNLFYPLLTFYLLEWCIACTQWQAEQTYDSIPQAAPNEVNEDTHEHEGVTDLAGGIGFDDDDEDYSDDEIITSSSLTTRTYDDGDYNGSDDDDDNSHQGIAEEDYNPTASVYGHGHYFEPDEDEESSDDDNVSLFVLVLNNNMLMIVPQITVSNVGPARNPSQGSAVGTTDTQQAAADRHSSHAAPLALSDAQVSGPAFSSSFGPDSHAGHNFAEDWVPEHLGRNDNLAALRTGGLLQRHVSGSGSNTPSGSIMSASGQTEIGLPRYTASSVRHGTSASFLSSAASAVSSDSQAGLATASNGSQAGSNENRRSPGPQSYDAYDAQGNVHRRVARPGNSTTAGSSRVSNQRSQTLKAPKGNGNFARVVSCLVFVKILNLFAHIMPRNNERTLMSFDCPRLRPAPTTSQSTTPEARMSFRLMENLNAQLEQNQQRYREEDTKQEIHKKKSKKHKKKKEKALCSVQAHYRHRIDPATCSHRDALGKLRCISISSLVLRSLSRLESSNDST